MTLVIMAAGMGSRYGGLKQLDPVGTHGEFIIDYSIYDAIQAGFQKVVFIIQKKNLKDFRETIGARIEKAVQVEYVFQEMDSKLPSGASIPQGREKPWGTAHAVLTAEDAVKDPFAVINADDYYGREAFDLLAKFLREQEGHAKNEEPLPFCMVGYQVQNTLTENGSVSRGVCQIEDNRLVQVVERLKIQQNGSDIQFEDGGSWVSLPDTATVSMNCWGFTPGLFDKIRAQWPSFLKNLEANPLKAEFFLPTVVQELIDQNRAEVTVLQTSAKWYGITYREDREGIVRYFDQLTKEKIYPEGLWK